MSQPYGQQPPNQPQPYYGQPVIIPPTSGKATASMILGLIGLISCGFTSLPAIILGHIAEGETRQGHRGGRGQAITGLIFGYLTAVPWIIFWGMVITGAVAAPFVPAATPLPTP
jgi:hypothetical protein